MCVCVLVLCLCGGWPLHHWLIIDLFQPNHWWGGIWLFNLLGSGECPPPSSGGRVFLVWRWTLAITKCFDTDKSIPGWQVQTWKGYVALWLLHSIWLYFGNMHIVYAQFRYRNSVQAIYILHKQYKQYTYWVRSTAIAVICNMVAVIPPYFSSRLWCHQSSFESFCNFTPYPLCTRKEVFGWFCHDNYIREKKKSETMTQKKIDGIKAYLKNVVWWRESDGSNHIAYCCNSHTAHSICIVLVQYVYCLGNMCIACAICVLLVQYVYCLCNMCIACALFLYLNCAYTI